MAAAARRQSVLQEFPDPAELESPKPLESPSWAGEVERFLEWKRSETLVGDDWIRRMRWELNRVPALLQKVGAVPIALTPLELSAEHFHTLRQKLPWARATFLLHFAALRQFLRFVGNPLSDRRLAWNLPSGEPSRRRWLTKDQLNKLYEISGGAARIIIGLEGLNGLRRVEVLRLRVRDILLEEDSLHVRGKGGCGGKWRKIPIHSAVRRDLITRIRRLDPDDPVVGLSKSGADLALARAARAAGLGLGVRVSHHDLRRSFGRLAHEAGMDMIQLRNMLGHTSLQMTEYYVGMDSERMREGLSLFEGSFRGRSGAAPGPPK